MSLQKKYNKIDSVVEDEGSDVSHTDGVPDTSDSTNTPDDTPDVQSNLSAAIDSVKSGDFVEFSKAIKQELNKRIHNHSYILSKKSEFKKYRDISNKYKEI